MILKKAFQIFSIASLMSTIVMAQTENTKEAESKKPSRDFVMLQLHYDNWHIPNGEDLGVKGFGRGFSGYLMYDFPIGQKETTNFSFAAGLGLSANNVYFKKIMPNMYSASDTITFMQIDSTWKGGKMNTAYLEMPLEIRFFGNANNRNKGFKMALGAKVGLLIGAHTKYSVAHRGSYIINKDNAKKYNQTWRLAPTFRIGYGNFSIFAQYGVTGFFNTNKGPEVHPFSIGLTISGL
jgi:hypothetical protein